LEWIVRSSLPSGESGARQEINGIGEGGTAARASHGEDAAGQFENANLHTDLLAGNGPRPWCKIRCDIRCLSQEYYETIKSNNFRLEFLPV
jgi:hypothetical protein